MTPIDAETTTSVTFGRCVSPGHQFVTFAHVKQIGEVDRVKLQRNATNRLTSLCTFQWMCFISSCVFSFEFSAYHVRIYIYMYISIFGYIYRFVSVSLYSCITCVHILIYICPPCCLGPWGFDAMSLSSLLVDQEFIRKEKLFALPGKRCFSAICPLDVAVVTFKVDTGSHVQCPVD